MGKIRILLTGATGVMGSAGLAELYARRDQYQITVFVRDTKVNRKKLAPYADIRVVWGDLAVYEDVLRGVVGADVVLHVGGMVSPKADYLPKTTRRVNVGAAENIVRAVNAQPNADQIKVVYIGSVAQTSDRNAPVHWGRTGDPISISVYDHYAITKTQAERVIVEGVKNWVSLRQSGILYAGILKNYDPIMFHVPINGVLEWATVEDSGRLLERVCRPDVPAEFWNKFYNIGSGDSYRITNYEFECKLLEAISCPAPEKIFDPHWFVTRNFHGQWYADSDKLEAIVPFRDGTTCDEYFARMSQTVPWFYKLAKVVPASLIKYLGMKPMASKKRLGTLSWLKNNETERIAAFYGSRAAWQALPRTWDQWDITPPTKQITLLDHGYDESKTVLTLEELQQAAAFRGGACLSEAFSGDWAEKLMWRCAQGHEFTASVALVLRGGHFCPKCLPAPWDYNAEARRNPFFAQVWTPLHGTQESDRYEASIYENWEK